MNDEQYTRYSVRMPVWLARIMSELALQHTRSLSGETVEAVKAYIARHNRADNELSKAEVPVQEQ
jgi:hypothetical protein